MWSCFTARNLVYSTQDVIIRKYGSTMYIRIALRYQYIDTGMSYLLVEMRCAATTFTKYCGSLALEKHSSLCAKLILNTDQLVKYLGFPLPELEIIYPICAKGYRKFRDAEYFEEIRYIKSMPLNRPESLLRSQ